MMNIRKLIAFLLVVALAAGLIACSGNKAATGQNTEENGKKTEAAGKKEEPKKTYKLRMAGIAALDYISSKEIVKTIDEIKEKTDGAVDIQFYPAGQLGDYVLVYEEVMKGTIDLAHITIPSQFDPKLEMNYIPYLLESYEDMNKIFVPGSFLYDTYSSLHESLGVKLLGLYSEGFMGTASKKMVSDFTEPGSKKEEVLRVPPIDAFKMVTEDLGFRTTSVPFADLYSALQTGVTDGWVGGPPMINHLYFRDVIKYYVANNYLMENTGLIMNNDLYNSMPAEYQEIISSCFMDVAKRSFKLAKESDEEGMKLMKEAGIEVIELTPEQMAKTAEYIRATTWPKLKEKLGAEIIEGILKDLE